jgi:hypothetical protein
MGRPSAVCSSVKATIRLSFLWVRWSLLDTAYVRSANKYYGVSGEIHWADTHHMPSAMDAGYLLGWKLLYRSHEIPHPELNTIFSFVTFETVTLQRHWVHVICDSGGLPSSVVGDLMSAAHVVDTPRPVNFTISYNRIHRACGLSPSLFARVLLFYLRRNDSFVE